jgi:hypothetical protein
MGARLAAMFSLAVLLGVPVPAMAQDGGGVFIDPSSPSAKEYAVPLERARRQADPGARPQRPVAQGQRSSPLFGEGISNPSTEKSAKKPTAAGKGGGSSSVRSATLGTAAPELVRSAAARPSAPGGGLSTPLVIAGVALTVLAVGGGAGLLLRRRG